jgi:hypothetical protein
MLGRGFSVVSTSESRIAYFRSTGEDTISCKGALNSIDSAVATIGGFARNPLQLAGRTPASAPHGHARRATPTVGG